MVFRRELHPKDFRGSTRKTFCNRGRLKGGIQLEVSRKERDLLKADKERLERFASAVRQAIQRFVRK
jgi:phage replication-related protein YjqB (UPF0714/DUF867 family)